ncbi:response regulator [Rivibacter subsaxonicus]|uniref:LuxR family two component transcriptional regulator n=1 Tax=Rivibacter subsaxonicus TaxID=457575 RepID=A0A4V6MEP8_9BURK|nr:response regulator transcription factor [Rivibacter subsaxonicus]RZU01246.1 LuxR family two component transcriptional regulator [Rivibacter subsaxonicus]
MSVLSVYLVEDDPLVAQHVREVIMASSRLRYVGHAPRLSVAREELPRTRPDVLLSDLGLPDGDGTELIGELSHAPAIEGVWHPHILVFSVFGDEARVINAIAAGADGYFLKGCSADELVRAVEQAARGESPISPTIARHLLKRFRDGGVSEDTLIEHEEVSVPGTLGDGSRTAVTVREHQVLKLVAQGYVAEEIGERLLTTPRAVATDVRNVYRKLQLLERARAVEQAPRRPGWA